MKRGLHMLKMLRAIVWMLRAIVWMLRAIGNSVDVKGNSVDVRPTCPPPAGLPPPVRARHGGAVRGGGGRRHLAACLRAAHRAGEGGRGTHERQLPAHSPVPAAGGVLPRAGRAPHGR
eukprot:1179137-Prorocentrum_minimum.AAC.2